MNITTARKLARQSTAHGYLLGGGEGRVTCPSCRARVTAPVSMHAKDSKGKKMSTVDQIRREVFEHLRWGCELDAKQFDGVYR